MYSILETDEDVSAGAGRCTWHFDPCDFLFFHVLALLQKMTGSQDLVVEDGRMPGPWKSP